MKLITEDVLVLVRDTIRRHAMLAGGDVVLVAVSGGADSTALLYLMSALAPEWDLRLHALHVDHGLRENSAADAGFVRDLGRDLVQIRLGQRQVIGVRAGMPERRHTSLLRGNGDLWRIVTFWRNRGDLDHYLARTETPFAKRLLESAGGRPTVEILEVVLDNDAAWWT